MTSKHKWIVLSILLFVGIPFTGSITGKATGSAQGGCGESRNLSAQIRKRSGAVKIEVNLARRESIFTMVYIDFERAVNSGEVSKGVCIAEQSSASDEIPHIWWSL